MKRIPLAILVGVVLVSTMSQAAQHTGEHTGERAMSLARATFEKSVEMIVADRHSKCMSAIGSPAFCTCLSSRLPIKADFHDFQTYIRVTTTSREEYGYERLAPEDMRTVDRIIATRGYCVAKVFATP